MKYVNKIKSFFKQLNTKIILENDLKKFLSEISYLNFSRLKVIINILIPIISILILLDYYNYQSGKWMNNYQFGKWTNSLGYKIIFYSHCTFIFSLITMAIILKFKKINRNTEVIFYHKNLINIGLFIGLFNIVTISIGDILINGSIAAYLGSVFAFATIFVMTTLLNLLFFLSSMIFMISLLIKVSILTGQIYSIQMINIIIYTIIAFVLSRIIFYYQMRDFKGRKLVKKQKDELENLAMKDYLTQAYNRRSFHHFSKLEFSRTKRFGTPLSLLLFDLDHFKEINDMYGHNIGDLILKKVSSLIQNNIRDIDIFVRWGGEEFIVFTPKTNINGIKLLSQKLCNIIDDYKSKDLPHFTASFGVTEYIKDETIDDMVNRADKALYIAKNNGRNCIKIL